MVYIFSQPFFVYIHFHRNQPNDRRLPVLCHFEGWCLWLWVGPSGPVRPLTEEVYTFIIN